MVAYLFRLCPIRHVNNIPTMQFCAGIPKNTQSELYYIILHTASLPEKSWEFQNNALWDTVNMSFWKPLLPVVPSLSSKPLLPAFIQHKIFKTSGQIWGNLKIHATSRFNANTWIQHGFAIFTQYDHFLNIFENNGFHLWVLSIDMEVSRLAIECPCPLRIMILCCSPRPKSGWKLGYVLTNQI